MKVPDRIRIFGWRLFHDSLPDAFRLRKIGCEADVECSFCGWKVEKSIHLFRDCWNAKAIGLQLKIPPHSFDLSGGSPADWLNFCAENLSTDEFRLIVCASWCIWHCRNEVKHGKATQSTDYIVAKVLSVCNQWDKFATTADPFLFSEIDPSLDMIFCDGSWSSADSASGLAAIYSGANLVKAVMAANRMGIQSSREAEGEALLLGLQLAASLCLPSVTFRSDSIEVVQAVFRGLVRGSVQPSWLSACLVLLAKFKGWRVAHCMREDNSKADDLAKFSRVNRWSWSNIHAIPWIAGND